MWCAPTCGDCSKSTVSFFQTLQCQVPQFCNGPSLELAGDALCSLECYVQKVSVQRPKRQSAPIMGWLTGHQELLFVEIGVAGSEQQGQRTSSGSPQHAENGTAASGPRSNEVWVWGDPVSTEAGMQPGGELLTLVVQASRELVVRVQGGQKTWNRDSVPPQLLGEAHFRIDEDVVPAAVADGAISLPLLLQGRVRGVVSMRARAVPADGRPNLVTQHGVADTLRDDRWVSFARSNGGGSGTLVESSRALRDRLQRLKGHSGSVTCCAVFPDGKKLLTGSRDQVAIVWSIASGEQLATMHGHAEPIVSCVVFASGGQVMTVSEAQVGIIWSADGRQLTILGGVHHPVAFPRSDRLLAAMGTQNAAVFTTLGQQICTLRGHVDSITACAVAQSEAMLLTASRDEDSILWTSAGETLRVLRGHSGAIACCAFFPSSMRVATGGTDATAIVWSTVGEGRQLGEQLVCLRGHKGPIRSCGAFPDEQRLLTTSEDASGIIWSVETGEPLIELKGHTECIVASRVLGSDRVLTVSEDKTGIVWAAETGTRMNELRGHSAPLCGGIELGNGTRVVTFSEDGTAIIWSVGLMLNGMLTRS